MCTQLSSCRSLACLSPPVPCFGTCLLPHIVVLLLFYRDDRDRYRLSADFATELALLQARFNRVVGLVRDEVPILVLRLSHAAGPAIRSGRLPLPAIVGHRSPLPAAAP